MSRKKKRSEPSPRQLTPRKLTHEHFKTINEVIS